MKRAPLKYRRKRKMVGLTAWLQLLTRDLGIDLKENVSVLLA